MKVSQTFGGKYWKAADVEKQTVTLKIKGCRQEEMPEDGGMKWVIFFHDCDKGLVLNATNGQTLGRLFGDDSDSWVNRLVELYPVETSFGPGIRMREGKETVPEKVPF